MAEIARPPVDRKARFKIPPQKPPKQDPAERIHNWREVFLGFAPDAAILEAQRCIQCPAAPCIKACPVHNDIPGALWLLEQGDFIGAAEKFRETSNLPEICGRICPQERLCEGDCVIGKNNKPVAIGKLEAFVADTQRRQLGGFPKPKLAPSTGKRVAIAGSGPAGIAVAEILTERGHACTIYEAWPTIGGILRYGIPNFKLFKDVVDEKVRLLEEIGIQFVTNTRIGRDITVEELLEEYDVVFLGTGAGIGTTLGIEGEDLGNIYEATDFLVRGNLPLEQLPEQQRQPIQVGKRVLVVGGGDTSMDCVRTAVRLGAQEVILVYRRTEAEMLGREEERAHAKEEGVLFKFLTTPVRFLGDESGNVKTVELIDMELGEPDASGRRRPLPKPNSNYFLDVDMVIIAIGYQADPLIGETTPGLETVKGLIVTDKATGKTSRKAIFAAGDNVNGADLVVTAMADARAAAYAIDRYLNSQEE